MVQVEHLHMMISYLPVQNNDYGIFPKQLGKWLIFNQL